MSLIFVGGINGVGKSSIIQELAKIPSVKVLDGATTLMKYLGIPTGDYEQLQELPESLTDKAIEKLFRDLSLERSQKNIVVTGHYVKVLRGRLSPSYGPWYQYCTALVLVLSNPQSILNRVLRDETSRIRVERNLFGEKHHSPQAKIRFLEAAQLISAEIIERAAKNSQKPYFYIQNMDGQLQTAVEQLVDILRKDF